jgi:hypothetical protein
VYFLFFRSRSTLSSYFSCESLVGEKALKAFALKHTFITISHKVTTVVLYKFSSCAALVSGCIKNVQPVTWDFPDLISGQRRTSQCTTVTWSHERFVASMGFMARLQFHKMFLPGAPTFNCSLLPSKVCPYSNLYKFLGNTMIIVSFMIILIFGNGGGVDDSKPRIIKVGNVSFNPS